MNARLAAWVLGFGMVLMSAMSAWAEARVALVIGNGAYAQASPLDKAVPDAELMARTLEGLGFQVVLLRDTSNATLIAAVADFGRALRDAGPEATGLFFYAGHAVQSQERNFLVPVDATVQDAADLDLVAVDAETVLRQMVSARNKANIFILNASRASPFEAVPDLGQPGLAQMTAPDGTFLAFAGYPGSVAVEGDAANSPYARALAALIISQGKPIDIVFEEVRAVVEQLTEGAQSPWEYSSLTEPFYFAPAASSPDEDAFWEAVKASGDPVELQMFLEAYPNSSRRGEAAALLAAAQASSAAVPADPPVAETTAAPAGDIAGADIAFEAPLPVGSPEIAGKSIAELIAAEPLYPPIEGLPDEAWKGVKCSGCHQWEKANLCEQGTFYVNETEFQAVATQHPLGGDFKLVLRRWAELGCP